MLHEVSLLWNYLTQKQVHPTDAYIKKVFDEIDIDKDGKISFDDWY